VDTTFASPDDEPIDGGTGAEAGDAASAEANKCTAGAKIFDATAVHEIVIDVSGTDWTAMIAEAEASPEYGGPPKTYFRAQFRFDGQTAEDTVGLRVKGHWGLINAHGHSFPLKVDFNRYVVGQSFDRLGKVNLHPSHRDYEPYALREHLSYAAIHAFEVPTARTSFASVTLNGEALGLYTVVEQIDGRFIKCHFEDPFGDLYKPEEANGSLADQGPSIDNYPEANHKWPDQTDHAAFLNLIDVINHQDLDRFPEVVDIEGILTYLAVNVGVGNHDYYASYGHNYYLYEATPDRFTMLPWDMNMSQSGCGHPCGKGRNSEQFPLSHRLLGDPTYTDQYAAILSAFVKGPGSITWQHARLDEALAVLGEHAPSHWRDELRGSIEGRVQQLEDGLTELTVCPEQVEED